MKLKELFSLLEGMSPQEKDNLQQELANKDINSVHRDGKIHVHPDDHSIAKKVAKRLGLEKHVVKNSAMNESFGQYKNHLEWKKEAEHRGLVVRKGTHPKTGEETYSTAKDKEGNHRGSFDHSTNIGNLNESDETISEGELKGNWTLEKVKNLTTQQRKVLAKNAAAAKDNQVLAMIDIANQPKAKVSAPKVDQGKLLDEIWMMVQQEVGYSVPDGDPIDRVHPALKRIMKKHDISFDDWDTTKWLDKAAKANNYKSYDAFVQDMIDEYKRVNEK